MGDELIETAKPANAMDNNENATVAVGYMQFNGATQTLVAADKIYKGYNKIGPEAFTDTQLLVIMPEKLKNAEVYAYKTAADSEGKTSFVVITARGKDCLEYHIQGDQNGNFPVKNIIVTNDTDVINKVISTNNSAIPTLPLTPHDKLDPKAFENDPVHKAFEEVRASQKPEVKEIPAAVSPLSLLSTISKIRTV